MVDAPPILGCRRNTVFTSWFFELGIHSFKDAVFNMNVFVGRLLGLNTEKHMRILDAGCGVGGVSLYLAQRYPTASFVGITIASEQVKLASNFCKKSGVSNVEFYKKSYLDTGFSDCSFDAVFAVESASYASSFNTFINEMYRVLKPDGKLVILDGFLQKNPSNDFFKKRYDSFCHGLGGLIFPHRTEAVSYLKKKGFSHVYMQNIIKNIFPSFVAHAVVGFPFFIADSLKTILYISLKKISTSLISSNSRNKHRCCISCIQ